MGFWIYPIIFVAKIVEVSISTIRIILMTKGKRLLSSLLVTAELTIWLLLVSTVITNIQSDPLRMIVYIIGCAIGIYTGATIEKSMLFGHSTLQIITENEEGKILAEVLREEGFGLTTFPAQGKDDDKRMMILHIRRKRLKDALYIVGNICPNAIITENESRTIRNGYGLRK